MNFTRWSARLPGTQRRAARGNEGSVPAARGEYGPRPEHPTADTQGPEEAGKTPDVDTGAPALEDFSVRDLLGRLPGLVALVYGPEHRIAYVNDAYASAFGPRTPGATVAATCPEAEELGLLPLLDQVLRSGKPRTVKSRRTAEGGSYTVTCLPVDSPHLDGAGVLVHAADVTDHAEAAERLRASERRQRETAVTLQRSLLPQELEQPDDLRIPATYQP
ncbi:PAS domain-containing protein, partial [Streptomyces sp. NPDC055051]